MKEELLNEEETLKMLKINKAQLENYVREGKLTPLYQESVRMFKLSDISRITRENPPSPTPPTTQPPEIEESFIKTQKEGSTRIIEPPASATKIGVNKTGSKGSSFEAEEETEKFLKQTEETAPAQGNLMLLVLLSVAFIISSLSVTMLTFALKDKEIPVVTKILSGAAGMVPIDKVETDKIKSEVNSVTQTAQKVSRDAASLTKDAEEFISLEE